MAVFGPDLTFRLTLGPAGGGATLGRSSSVAIMVRDTDAQPVPLVLIVSVGVVSGSRKVGVTGFLVTFSGPLDVASSQNLANYQFFQVVKKGKKTTQKPIALRSVVYDALRAFLDLRHGQEDGGQGFVAVDHHGSGPRFRRPAAWSAPERLPCPSVPDESPAGPSPADSSLLI